MAHRSLSLRVWDAALGHIQTHHGAGSVIDSLLVCKTMELLLLTP
ncbi:hypothetical protein [Synechococcus sp. WH 8016]|nr:hypothetical protein [Synechococcus sp. WH 8016]